MPRWASYSSLDTQLSEEGDNLFVGVDQKHDRGTLPQGMLAKSQNKRLRTGVAKTRYGLKRPTFCSPAFVNQICGSGIYNNPNGAESMMVAEVNQTYVWELREGVAPLKINLPGGLFTSNFQVEFCQ